MDKIKVNFVSQGNAYLASHRMRVERPAELLNVATDIFEATTLGKAVEEGEVNIFFKHFDKESNLWAIEKSKVLGFDTIFDVCDDHFDREHGEYYEAMCQNATHITCNSKNMQERIYEVTGKLSRIIPDPITFPFREVKEDQGEEPKLFFFGHSSNLNPLVEWLPFLEKRVTVMSDAGIQHPNIDFIPWKPLLVEHTIKDFDIVLIPNTNHPWTKCKSPNRAVDAIQSGKLVITDNREVYGDLEDYLWIIDSPDEIPEIIESWKTNYDDVQAIIAKGQEFIKKHYGNQMVLDGWLDTFKDIGLIKGYDAET